MVHHGRIFLGKDEKTYGKEGTGMVDYDPDFECGGKPGTPGRQCAYQTEERHVDGLKLKGREGRNLHVNIASYRYVHSKCRKGQPILSTPSVIVFELIKFFLQQ